MKNFLKIVIRMLCQFVIFTFKIFNNFFLIWKFMIFCCIEETWLN